MMKRSFIALPFWRAIFCATLLVATTYIMTAPRAAYAVCVCCCNPACPCSINEAIDNNNNLVDNHQDTRDHFGAAAHPFTMDLLVLYAIYSINAVSPIGIDIRGNEQGDGRIGDHQVFIWEKIWFSDDSNRGHFLPIWMYMAEQFTVTMLWHTETVGKFLDAKIQLEAQDVFRRRMAETHKRYQPSVSMCTIGTNVRSLAASERKGELSAHAMNMRLMDRQLGTEGGSAVMGPTSDQLGRIVYFRNRVCDRFDNNRQDSNPNTGFGNICDTAPRSDGTVNMDVDFTRLMMNPRTLNVDPTNIGATADNQSDKVFALAANLYGNKVPSLVNIGSEAQVSLANRLLDLRSVIASRSVAQTSYNALVGLKARGSAQSNSDTLQYMSLLLEELGMTAAEVSTFLGENPSYYAQMEVMAKKMYQNPDFYRELYDKPENVKRKSVAMSAIAAMLDREIFESSIRAEAMLSQLLEMKVIVRQEGLDGSVASKSVKD